MLSTGAIAVPSACLRCQLRQVISSTGRRVSAARPSPSKWSPSRAFKTSAYRCQDADQKIIDDYKPDIEESKLSEHPLGRIYGKRGRRHRQTSARLAKESMEKPFDVVLLRDVSEQSKDSIARTASKSHAEEASTIDGTQIARDVLENTAPSEAEIFTSIESLRPDRSILEKSEYDAVARSLLDGYSLRQLSQYLARATVDTSRETSQETALQVKKETRISPWRPGTTPLQQRHDAAHKLRKGETGTRSKTVDRILRTCWNVTVEGEMQQLGELEMELDSWQVSFLFDVQQVGKPMFESLLDSPLLVRSAEVRPYRPDNTMRIVARKSDAEDIARKIHSKLQAMTSIRFDLTPFESFRTRRKRSNSVADSFSQDFLQSVQQRLQCAFERRDRKTFVIHAATEEICYQARRMLLSFLDLPSSRLVDFTTSIAAPHSEVPSLIGENAIFIPEQASMDIKTRGRNEDFGRMTVPSNLQLEKAQNEERNTTQTGETQLSASNVQANDLTARLLAIKPPSWAYINHAESNDTQWRLPEALQWEAQFCKILHKNTNTSNMTGRIIDDWQRKGTFNIESILDKSSSSIVQQTIPGVADLLPHFLPVDEFNSNSDSTLIAYFVPSPLSKHGIEPLRNLPRIQLTYRVSQSDDARDNGLLSLVGIRAVLSEQELRIRLPEESTDLRMIQRYRASAAKGSTFNHTQVERFTESLQQDLRQGRTTLQGEPSITFQLPGSPFTDLQGAWAKELRKNDFKMEYLLEGFEQTQSVYLEPVKANALDEIQDPVIKQVLCGMPESMSMSYREVEGGFVGGRRSVLSLTYSQGSLNAFAQGSTTTRSNNPKSRDAVALKKKEGENRLTRLVESSLGVARVLTRINAGEVIPQRAAG